MFVNFIYFILFSDFQLSRKVIISYIFECSSHNLRTILVIAIFDIYLSTLSWFIYKYGACHTQDKT